MHDAQNILDHLSETCMHDHPQLYTTYVTHAPEILLTNLWTQARQVAKRSSQKKKKKTSCLEVFDIVHIWSGTKKQEDECTKSADH